jgi:hypothetical protein
MLFSVCFIKVFSGPCRYNDEMEWWNFDQLYHELLPTGKISLEERKFPQPPPSAVPFSCAARAEQARFPGMNGPPYHISKEETHP